MRGYESGTRVGWRKGGVQSLERSLRGVLVMDEGTMP